MTKEENMEIRNLTTFLKIADCLNFSKAASELGYAQSTVTMQIQQLETELNVRLNASENMSVSPQKEKNSFLSQGRSSRQKRRQKSSGR